MKEPIEGTNQKWYGLIVKFLQEIISSSGKQINSPMKLAFFGGVLFILLGLIVQPLAKAIFGAGNAISDGQFNLVITGGGLLIGLGLIIGAYQEWLKSSSSMGSPQADAEKNVETPPLAPSQEKFQPKIDTPRDAKEKVDNRRGKESQMKLKDVVTKDERKFLADCLSESDLVVDKTSRKILCESIGFRIPEYISHEVKLVFSKAFINDLIDSDRQESFFILLDDELIPDCEKNHPEHLARTQEISQRLKVELEYA